MSGPPILASCSLDAAAQSARIEELRSLLGPRLRGRERAPARLVLTLDLDAATHRDLAHLLDLERECCPFWRFAVTPAGERLTRLEVGVEAGYESALEAFDALVSGQLRERACAGRSRRG